MCINIHNILVSVIYIRWIEDAPSVVCLSGPPSENPPFPGEVPDFRYLFDRSNIFANSLLPNHIVQKQTSHIVK